MLDLKLQIARTSAWHPHTHTLSTLGVKPSKMLWQIFSMCLILLDITIFCPRPFCMSIKT